MSDLPKAIVTHSTGSVEHKVLELDGDHPWYNPRPVATFSNAERAVAYAAFLSNSARATFKLSDPPEPFPGGEVSGFGYARDPITNPEDWGTLTAILHEDGTITAATIEEAIQGKGHDYVLPPELEAEWERTRDLPFRFFKARYLEGRLSPHMTEWVRRMLATTRPLFDAADIEIPSVGEILARHAAAYNEAQHQNIIDRLIEKLRSPIPVEDLGEVIAEALREAGEGDKPACACDEFMPGETPAEHQARVHGRDDG